MNRAVDIRSPRMSTDRGTIFAVDDDENDRLLFVRCINEANVPFRCRLFSAGEQVMDALIDVLRGAPMPVACFVDIKMGGMSGLDVLRWIRAQHSLDGMPVIILSSSDAAQFLAEAHQFGAQCYATKFPSVAEMRQILAAAEQFGAAANGGVAFPVPCNLILGAGVA